MILHGIRKYFLDKTESAGTVFRFPPFLYRFSQIRAIRGKVFTFALRPSGPGKLHAD
jgi:hypothetical protein